ncbi:MAG: hypothetical protein ETSY2_32470 [Candidatus Entotheonella gemina]|uniref:Uncharacterized protein n=1 Tax=Candidatus Entotheonella gemina TaxID=1429439 RepID=W4M2G2_9BACT|nr:MAG: hypothetical protein ETSY2_32470 [Candidatus Entotheonella gemina]
MGEKQGVSRRTALKLVAMGGLWSDPGFWSGRPEKRVCPGQ